MIKKFTILFSVFALLLCLGTVAFGQETTGDIEITVKDPNGAVVPNVSITVASSETSVSATAGFRRTVTTDDQGFVRVIQVASGVYTVTAAPTAGFAERVIPGVQVLLGRVTPVTVDLGVANVDPTTVEVNSTDVNPIDVTDTKIQTSITAETAELLPKGVNFSSVLKVSPATRAEPLGGGFQIDGASGSENVFIIDGQEVTNVRTGTLEANSDLPFQIVQEVQVKSSGFEAEYGGATGGVINVVTKGGGNTLRGDFGLMFQPGRFQARGRDALRLNTVTQEAEYFPSGSDKSLGFFPSASLGGPIIKDRVWFFGSYTPQIFTRTRTITYLNPVTRNPTGVVETYDAKQTNEYIFARVDAQPFSRLRLTSAYTFNPIAVRGTIPAYVSAFDFLQAPLPNTNPAIGTTSLPQNGLPGALFLQGAAFNNQTGGRQNSQSITGQAVWTPTNNLVLSFRGGHYFLNEKLGAYGIGDVTIPRVTCSGSSPGQFPAGFGCQRGFNNGLPVNAAVLFDATERNTFDADATFVFNGLGRHELKGGYQYNGIANVLNSTTRSQIVFRYGQTIESYSGQNIPSSPNAVGAGLLRQYNESGNVSSKNEGLFIQDKWQPTARLTLNLGVRVEREDVPSFTEGLPGIKFDFGDKIAPRIGGAFDLTGDGKTKVSAFYGWFYDRFKYELPRGSFGGAFYHDFFYEIFPGDTLATLNEAGILAGYTPTIGGRCPTGTTTPIGGRVRCDIDYRVPSNAGLGIEFGAIDPNIKAFRQSELTFTFERDLGRNLVFASRYTRKNVDTAVEDAGFPTSEGSEAYIIGNPGEGLYAEVAQDNGLQLLIPQRLYQALEFRLDRRFADNWYFNLNYTYSRLYGNYSGLASSDEDGRTSPNVNRFFDLPHAGYTVAGGQDNGLLPTDRPHVIKFFGAYNFDWNDRLGFGANNETTFSLYTTAQSGTPVTTRVDIANIDTVVLTKRGDLGRTETFTQTDVALRHSYKFGRDNRFSLKFDLDILNLFNEANELNRFDLINDTNFSLTGEDLGLVTEEESEQLNGRLLALQRFQNGGSPNLLTVVNNPDNRYPLFNLPNAFQGGRTIRFGFRFLF